MPTRKEECGEGDNLVELHVRVERDELLQGALAHLGDEVAAHGEQQNGVTEGQRGRRSPRERYSGSHDVPKVHVFSEVRVV